MNSDEADELSTYIQQRNEAFRNLDVTWAREQLFRGRPETASEETVLASLHKARYECWHIEAPLRHGSRKWLEERGLGRMLNLPWPPEGELPR